MSSVDWRELHKYRSVTTGGQEGEIPRYLIDNLINTLGQGNPNNVRFLLVPTNTLTVNEWCPDLGVLGMHAHVMATHDADPTLRGGMLNPLFNGTDEYWQIADHPLLSAIDIGGTDEDIAASWGCAFNFNTTGAIKMLIAKEDDVAVTAREWSMELSATELLYMRLYDDSVPATAGRYYNTALLANTWYVVIATYDGRGGADAYDGIKIYLWEGDTGTWLDRVDDTDVIVGVYTDMEDLAEPVLIGANNSPAHAEEWPGNIVLPFMVAGDLSNVRGYSASGGVKTEITYAEHACAIMRRMLGL